MVAVRMVEVAFDQVIGVIAMRNCLVAAIGAVFVAVLMPSAFVVRGTRCRVLPAHSDLVLINVITVRMMEVPVMKIVLMTVMLHGHMSAVWTVHVRVRFVNLMIAAHLSFSLVAFDDNGASLGIARLRLEMPLAGHEFQILLTPVPA